MSAAATHHVALRVSDLQRATDFYLAVFGAERSLDEPMAIEGEVAEMTVNGPAGTKMGIEMLAFPGGGAVELFRFEQPAYPTGPAKPWETGLMHFAVQVDDVDATLERALAAGAEKFWPEVYELGSLRITYILDPDGNVVELIDGSMAEMTAHINTR